MNNENRSIWDIDNSEPNDVLKKDIYQEAVDIWGQDIQIIIAIEEFSELTKALCKFKRFLYQIKNNLFEHREIEFDFDNLLEEIANSQIMLNQLKCIFGKLSYKEKKEDAIMNLLTRIARAKEERKQRKLRKIKI